MAATAQIDDGATATKSANRNRYDSGYYDDAGGDGDTPAPSHNWNDVVSDWSFRTHSVITQEVIRMKAMTEARRKQSAEATTRAAREAAVQCWKEDMRDMMEITVDLIQCVANDVEETNSAPASTCSGSMTSQDLGKIIEDELFDAHGDKTILLVRTKKTKRRKRNRGSKSDRRKFEAKRSFTIRVDELGKKEEARVADAWKWKKDLESPTVWDFDEASPSNNFELEPEDIYRDWVRLLRRTSSTDSDDRDINDVFWSISLGCVESRPGGNRRERRISEVLENLPFQDRPDIFEDRCEILETATAMKSIGDDRRQPPRKQVTGRKKQPKCYWNIFDEWKKIFREPRPRVGKRRQQKRKASSRKANEARKRRRGGNKKRVLPPQPALDTPEDFFCDFLSAFEENVLLCDRGRRRSRELVDDDEPELVAAENARKKRKTADWTSSGGAHRKNWDIIRMESSKAFDMITKNIEQKIREAFQEAKREDGPRKEVAVSTMDKSESRSADPRQKAMEESRREFVRLREQVRQVRYDRVRRRPDYATLFADWKWNLEGRFEYSISPVSYKKPKQVANFKAMPIKLTPSTLAQKGDTRASLRRLPRQSLESKAKRRISVKCRPTQPRRRGSARQ